MSGDASTTARARESPPDEVKILQGKLHRFLVDQHQVLAGFAACKYTKNGPGALFVFANVNLKDLLVEPRETARRASPSARGRVKTRLARGPRSRTSPMVGARRVLMK